MKATQKVRKEVLKTLNDSMKAFVSRDTEKAVSYYAKDKDLISIGTEDGEIIRGITKLRKSFDVTCKQFEKFAFKTKIFEVSAAGNVAWASGIGTYDIKAGGKKFKIAGRFSMIFEKRGKDWLIVHAHYSLPV